MRKTLLIVLFGLLAACASDGTRRVTLKGQTFRVEVVSDDAGRERGLMFRDQMAADHGMLFVFPHSQNLSFWMKNTHIPLDILYFDEALGFVSAALGTPPCGQEASLNSRCPNYPSSGMARYVLELNAGIGAALQLQPGDRIELPKDLPPAH